VYLEQPNQLDNTVIFSCADNGACESLGKARLFVDDKVVAEGPLRTQSGHFTLCGD
jgi:hypothetical protein